MNIRYSQEARMYALAAFLALVNAYWFVRLTERPGRSAWIGYVVSAILLVYAHNSGWFLLVIESLAVLWGGRRRRESGEAQRLSLKHWGLGQLAVLAAMAPWVVLFCIFNARGHRGNPGIEDVGGTLLAYAGSWCLLMLLGTLAAVCVLVDGPKTASSADGGDAVSGGGRWSLSLARGPGTGFLLTWWLAPPLLLYLVCEACSIAYVARYALIASLPLYLLAAGGALRIPWRLAPVVVAALGLLLAAVPLSGYYASVDKEQWREATAYIDARAARGDRVFLNDARAEFYARACFDLYSQRDDLVKARFPFKPDPVLGRAARHLDPRIKELDHFWILLCPPDQRIYPLRLAREAGFTQTALVRFHLMEVYYFERVEPGAKAPVAGP